MSLDPRLAYALDAAKRAGLVDPKGQPVVNSAPPARGQTWQSRTDRRVIIRVRSEYPHNIWRCEGPDGTRVMVGLPEFGTRFVLVGAPDGR